MRAGGLVLSAVLIAGCADKPAEKPVAVRGTATLDGVPMPDGELMLFPEGGPPAVFPIRGGAFEGEVVPGTYKVSVFAFKTLPPRRPAEVEVDIGDAPPAGAPRRVNVLPPRFNTECKQTVEVTPAGPNEFTFPTESK